MTLFDVLYLAALAGLAFIEACLAIFLLVIILGGCE